jgi:outer membrane receptor protein involved in Fe transport
VEAELGGNPTPSWRLAVSVAKFNAAESNIGVPWVPLVKQLAPVWAQNSRVPIWDDSTRTIGELYQSVVSALNQMQKSDGTKVESAREWRVRATTRYSFREGWLRNTFVGASYIWSSENVVGFRQITVPNDYPELGIGGTVQVADINHPYQGNPTTALDGFAGYSCKLLRGKIGWRVQLNVRNLFDDDSLLIRDVYSDGSPRQINVAKPRLFILTNTFSY